MIFADVYVPYPLDTPFTYSIPDGVSVLPGCRVRVDFGGRTVTGWVVDVHGRQPDPSFQVKHIQSVIDAEPVFDSRLVDLARYVSDAYVSTIGETLALALPGGEKPSGRHRIPCEAVPETAFCLSGDQSGVVDSILKLSGNGVMRHLLFGVTGSGKTEVYLELARKVLETGRSVLYMVPEIMLSSQIFRRLAAFFGDDLILYHSGLTAGQRLYNWQRYMRGEARVAIGTRSAVFLQAPDLGLIVIDEEHDGSYKEHGSPRYNAKHVAWYRSEKEKTLLVMGSATPSIESLYSAERGQMHLHRLEKRHGNKPMPPIEIVNIRDGSGKGTLSASLKVHTRRAVDSGNQVILLLNRRGFSPSVVCERCGRAVECPDCSISLTYHSTGYLLCHYCGHQEPVPDKCPLCGCEKLIRLGAGTQRVEEEIQSEFRDMSIFRLDQDTAHRKSTANGLVDGMEKGAIDILLGTQMVAKGFHFPRVTVVGVLMADIGLNVPDFRSSERIFSLLVQVAGRCGRGDNPGRVIIQTLDPGHSLFRFISGHDYYGFYRSELDVRRMLQYPPFGRLVRLLVRGRDRERVQRSMALLKSRLDSLSPSGNGNDDVLILGPAEAPIARISGNHRYHILLKGRKGEILREMVRNARDAITDRTCYLEIDIDPVDIL